MWGEKNQVSFWKGYNKVMGNSAQILTCGKCVTRERIVKWECNGGDPEEELWQQQYNDNEKD